jgi:hypothetical protein
MPYDAEPIDFDAELRRLGRRYQSAVETAEDDDATEKEREQAREAATRMKRHAGAVEWLRDEFGADCRVVVGGLTMGEDARVTDAVDAAAEAKTHGGVRGLARNYTVAAGVVEAPFYDDETNGLEDRVAAVAELPRHVGKFLHHKIAVAEDIDTELGNG